MAEQWTEYHSSVLSQEVKARYQLLVHQYNLFQFSRLALVISRELTQFHVPSLVHKCNMFHLCRLVGLIESACAVPRSVEAMHMRR
jgi:hypothetical protein